MKLASISGTVIANSSLNLVGLGATIIALQVGRGCAGGLLLCGAGFQTHCALLAFRSLCTAAAGECAALSDAAQPTASCLSQTLNKHSRRVRMQIPASPPVHCPAQATVGSLVAKTLSAASAAGFYGQRTAPPPAAFDVFSVQVWSVAGLWARGCVCAP